MSLLFIAFSSIICWFTVLRPLLLEVARYERRRDAERLYYFRLKWVRRWYPDLRELSIHELEREYDINSAYQQLQYVRTKQDLLPSSAFFRNGE